MYSCLIQFNKMVPGFEYTPKIKKLEYLRISPYCEEFQEMSPEVFLQKNWFNMYYEALII